MIKITITTIIYNTCIITPPYISVLLHFRLTQSPDILPPAMAALDLLVGSCDTMNTPFMLVDLDRVEVNCSRMRNKCEQLGIHLRPHMKTHKTM